MCAELHIVYPYFAISRVINTKLVKSRVKIHKMYENLCRCKRSCPIFFSRHRKLPKLPFFYFTCIESQTMGSCPSFSFYVRVYQLILRIKYPRFYLFIDGNIICRKLNSSKLIKNYKFIKIQPNHFLGWIQIRS